MPPEQPQSIDQPKDSKESKKNIPKESIEQQEYIALKQKIESMQKWLDDVDIIEDQKDREDALRVAIGKVKKLFPELKISTPEELREWMQSELVKIFAAARKMDPMSDYICEQYPRIFFKSIERPEAKLNPRYLHFLEKAVRSVVDEEPGLALYSYDSYKDQPYAKEILEKAVRFVADKNPRYAFEKLGLYKDQPYAKEILEKAVRSAIKKEPGLALYSYDSYKDQPYAKEILEKAVRSAIDKAPGLALQYFFYYEDQPYAKEILEKAVRSAIDKDPRSALYYYNSYKDQPYAKEVLEKAVRYAADKDLGAAIDYFDSYKDQPYAKEILEKMGLYLSNNLTSETALRIVRLINDLHDVKDELRFLIVEKMPASALYALMVEGDREIFTSSFNGLFNRFLAKMHAEEKKGDQVMQSGDGTKTFLRLCASYNRLSEFLATMDPTKAQQILRDSVIDLGKPEDRLKNAVTLADTFSVLKDPTLMSSMSGFVKEAYAKAEKSGDIKFKKLYGLLASIIATKINDPWFSQMAVKYPLENVSSLPSKELFNPDNKNIQQYFFYKDKDGKDSFANFLRYYKSQPDWKMQDRGSYIYISKKIKDRTVEMYANKPENEEDGPDDIQKEFATRNIKTIVVVHRGHSFHAAKTIKRITDIARIVWMGSCGGYREVAGVLEKSPKAHIISTKGTGTMLINDPLLKALNETILSGKDIVWSAFWAEAEKKLGKNENFPNYVAPDKNLGVNFMKAYQKE